MQGPFLRRQEEVLRISGAKSSHSPSPARFIFPPASNLLETTAAGRKSHATANASCAEAAALLYYLCGRQAEAFLFARLIFVLLPAVLDLRLVFFVCLPFPRAAC
jgi:hypothetical protein